MASQEDDGEFWEDREATRKIAPTYVNRLFVERMGEGVLRISFGQINLDGVDYYTSIALTAQNAVQFGNLIARWGVLNSPPVPMPPPPAPPSAMADDPNV